MNIEIFVFVLAGGRYTFKVGKDTNIDVSIVLFSKYRGQKERIN